jgi:uridine phosphorylase
MAEPGVSQNDAPHIRVLPQGAEGRGPAHPAHGARWADIVVDEKANGAGVAWPIVGDKQHDSPSVFRPEALLREARRQRELAAIAVPAICMLDPDGDVVRYLKRTGAGRIHEGWACYHTELLAFDLDGIGEVGIVGCAVGAPFAVLVAEQLFASGCRLLVSVTSAGQINPIGPTPYFVLIDRALRDEGTSYHYLPGSTFAEAPDTWLLDRVERAGRSLPEKLHRGSTWTTDAPYRETEAAIARARDLGTLAVEMEAAALYAFSATSGHPVVCFAHVTNSMAQTEGDFEKGEADGAKATLAVVAAAARGWSVPPTAS